MSKAVNTGNGFPSGVKNRIINGDMTIAQRGTSFTPSMTATTYLLDRWFTTANNDGAATVTQNADVPSNLEFQNSLRFAVTTADSSIASGQWCNLIQRIEGYNVRDLIGRTFTYSFWVRSSKTGIHCTALTNSAGDRSYISEYTISVADTWQYKTITIAGGLPTAGTWNYTNAVGLNVVFALAGGSTYQTTADSWKTGNFTNTSNQVNCLDTIGNIFAITGVQLELGPVATPFEHRLFGTELALCQRYYQLLYPNNIIGYCQSTAGVFFGKALPVNIRTTPSVTFIGATAAVVIYGNGSITTSTSASLDTSSTDNIGFSVTTPAVLTIGQACRIQVGLSLSISAEL